MKEASTIVSSYILIPIEIPFFMRYYVTRENQEKNACLKSEGQFLSPSAPLGKGTGAGAPIAPSSGISRNHVQANRRKGHSNRFFQKICFNYVSIMITITDLILDDVISLWRKAYHLNI